MKERIDEDTTKLYASNNKSRKYKVKAISNSAIYIWNLKLCHLPRLYHLISWNGYLKEENI